MLNGERRRESIELLLAAAQQTFIRQGYGGTSVEQIARQAGFAKGVVYFYFRDKASLLIALIDRIEKTVIDPLLEEQRRADLSAEEKLVTILHRQSFAGRQQGELLLLPVLVSVEIDAAREPQIAARVEAYYAKLRDALTAIVAQGQKSGEFDRRVRAREQANVVMALHDGMLLEWLRQRQRVDGRELVRAMRLMALEGLRARR